MDPLFLFAATVVTDESRARFAAAGRPADRTTVPVRARRPSLASSVLRPVRRHAAAAAA